MYKQSYIPPALLSDAFNCPDCTVFAKQSWFHLQASQMPNGGGFQYKNHAFRISVCEKCTAPTIWWGSRIVFPMAGTAAPPNADIPEDIAVDYEEARIIAGRSPRGAAALLRLCVQKLCAHLGQPGKNINLDIGALVIKGLPPKVQQALDSVRVIGNDAVHPGSIDLRDDRETVDKLFRLVNFIADKMITEPREIEELYEGLPAEKLAAIAKRDE